MNQESPPEVYQLHVWIRQISPMIWRRLLLRSDSTLTYLHHALQIAFGWSDFHLHQFRIRNRYYSINNCWGSNLADDGSPLKLADFRFQTNECFFYEYDFGDLWRHEIRIVRRLAVDEKRTYPTCVGGQRAGPPEDCGGPWAFMERRDEAPWEAPELLWQIADDLKAGDLNPLRDRMELIRPLLEWLTLDRFDRRQVNRRLKQYALGDEKWMWE